MWKGIFSLLFVAFLVAVFFALLHDWSSTDSPDYVNYQWIENGMSVHDVQAILGPGTPIDAKEVPSVVVPLNPDEARTSYERASRSGTIPTVRDYATRNKPVVKGDYILKWKNSTTYERILVAFRNGKVSEKHYWDPNYL